ncbi:MAG: hypothetical protein WBW81_04405 [Methylocella sp.]
MKKGKHFFAFVPKRRGAPYLWQFTSIDVPLASSAIIAKEKAPAFIPPHFGGDCSRAKNEPSPVISIWE